MNPYKLLSYAFVWSLALVTSRFFYSKFLTRNKERLRLKNPTILVTNHPNTLFDPFMAAIPVNRFVHFLANAGMFEIPVMGPFLGSTFGIKVERRQDVAKDGVKLDNDKAFRFAEDFLTKGGCLYIAAEGGSDIPRRIRRFKTGSARIALSTEDKNDFKLGLEILIVGLNYQDQRNFRTPIFRNVGEPIKVADFAAIYRKDKFQAVTELTAAMQRRAEDLTIHTRDDEEDALMRKIEEVVQTENPLTLDLVFDRTKKIINNWQKMQDEQPAEAISFQSKMEQYFSFLQKNKTRDSIVKKTQKSNAKMNWWMRTIFMVLGYPTFVYGWVNNFLANYTPAFIYGKLKLHPAYTSAVKILAGIFTYLIFYGLQIWIFKQFFTESWMTWVYIVSLVLTGLFAWWFKDFAKDTLGGWRLFRIPKKDLEPILETRKSIVTQINSLLK
ncbi:MAG: 1-acyl-sn-glycerol-3-phosphate acyltransferase [Saprospiraceae bacterium]